MKKKGFLSAFYPDEWVDSTYSIDFGDWYERGFRGVIFDIDNTLVPHARRQTNGLWLCLNTFTKPDLPLA